MTAYAHRTKDPRQAEICSDPLAPGTTPDDTRYYISEPISFEIAIEKKAFAQHSARDFADHFCGLFGVASFVGHHPLGSYEQEEEANQRLACNL